MPFGGAVAATIARLKAHKRTHISTFEKKDSKKNKKTELFFPKKSTQSALTEIAKKIQKEKKVPFLKCTFLIIAILVLLYILN